MSIKEPHIDKRGDQAGNQIDSADRPETAIPHRRRSIALLDWSNVRNWVKKPMNCRISNEKLYRALSVYVGKQVVFTWDVFLGHGLVRDTVAKINSTLPLKDNDSTSQQDAFEDRLFSAGEMARAHYFDPGSSWEDKVERFAISMEQKKELEKLRNIGFDVVTREASLIREKVNGSLVGRIHHKSDVDALLVNYVYDPARKVMQNNDFFVICSGDSDFKPMYETLLEQGKTLAIISTKESLSGGVERLAAKFRGRMSVILAEAAGDIWTE